jgi:diguanylate cyclase (GGDEF)-like protein
MQIAGADFLTQLPNRRSAIQFLEQAHALFKRHGHSYTVIMFDIDHFKSVNDTYGHNAGDKVLQKISATMKTLFRETDMFARFGGEEFIAVLPATDICGAIILSEKIRSTVESTAIEISKETTLHKTVSIGIAEAVASDADFSKAVGRSDEALYSAKTFGRNKICTSPLVDVARVLNDSAPAPQSTA